MSMTTDKVIKKLTNRYDKCLNSFGDYVENQLINFTFYENKIIFNIS